MPILYDKTEFSIDCNSTGSLTISYWIRTGNSPDWIKMEDYLPVEIKYCPGGWESH
jgi:hypothetical protein